VLDEALHARAEEGAPFVGVLLGRAPRRPVGLGLRGVDDGDHAVDVVGGHRPYLDSRHDD
jgi:hypothetical protein